MTISMLSVVMQYLALQVVSCFRTISASIEEWLSERFEAYKTTGQVELVTRAFLHWLDGALEELFTQGLRTVSAL